MTYELLVTREHCIVESPIGPLTVVVEDAHVVALFMDEHRHAPESETFGERVDDVLPAAREQLAEYFAGHRRQFDLPLNSKGTAFQERVWQGLCDIPYGETWSYGKLAAHVGSPGGSRAVGLANGRNPISILVPCHRVIGADGRLTGYGGGMDRKQFLLELEGALTPGAACR